jgi:hypothetical protein
VYFIEGKTWREIEKKLIKNQRKINFSPLFKFKIENSEFRKPPKEEITSFIWANITLLMKEIVLVGMTAER